MRSCKGPGLYVKMLFFAQRMCLESLAVPSAGRGLSVLFITC